VVLSSNTVVVLVLTVKAFKNYIKNAVIIWVYMLPYAPHFETSEESERFDSC
jgi:hypothetical protein